MAWLDTRGAGAGVGSIPEEEKVFGESFKDKLTILAYKAPWYVVISLFRLLYGFEAEGFENIPDDGPFITLVHEPSLIGVFVIGWAGIEILLNVNLPKGIKSQGYQQDQLFAISYFRSLQKMDGAPKSAALIPHSAGRMALSLVDGYRTLRDGGTVTINPEGDGPWDGRPLPTRMAPAWLGLHTAAPLIPIVTSLGAYDIFPRWARGPYLSGKLKLTIGEPFQVAETPLARPTDEDLEKAQSRIRAEFDRIRYGPGGFAEWTGPPMRDGVPVEAPVEFPTAGPVLPLDDGGRKHVAVSKKRIAQLLWRCPVCRTNDALLHRKPLLGFESVACRACGTRWRIRHVPEKDFRLEVIAGAPELVGLDMALTTWYDQMKRDFQPQPIAAAGVELAPGEEVLLETGNVTLSPHQPNPIFEEGWDAPEAPQDQESDSPHLGEWDSLGEGRLLLTNRRLI